MTSVTGKLTCSRSKNWQIFGLQICVKCIHFEVLPHMWYQNNQTLDHLSWNNHSVWYSWKYFHHNRICTTLFWTLNRSIFPQHSSNVLHITMRNKGIYVVIKLTGICNQFSSMYSLGQKFCTFKWEFFSSLPWGDSPPLSGGSQKSHSIKCAKHLTSTVLPERLANLRASHQSHNLSWQHTVIAESHSSISMRLMSLILKSLCAAMIDCDFDESFSFVIPNTCVKDSQSQFPYSML